MNSVGQGLLVARRELRERSQSAAFRVSMVLMVLGVAAAIALPGLISSGGGTKVVGLTGTVPGPLSQAIVDQGRAAGTKVRTTSFGSVTAGEAAVRGGKADVLVVDAARLEWRRQPDEQLKAVVTAAIQLVAVQERAAEAGIGPGALTALLTPVQVTSTELSRVAGRSRDDETAALVMTLVLFYAVTVYGAMVMNGVVEEKTSRVVEVLLAKMPARTLLAGKVAGIGLLGLAQIAATAIVALVASATLRSFDIPAVRAPVIAWAVVWFVLGYGLYATLFGALGSLASRTEDAQAVAGPVTGLLVVGYFFSFATIGSPHASWARLLSFFPPFAPFAIPNRLAMGGTAWWEPVVATVLTLGAIAGLVRLGGRLYTAEILHSGATIGVRDAWQRATRGTTTDRPTRDHAIAQPEAGRDRLRSTALVAATACVVGGVFAATRDFIIGVAVGAAFYAVAFRIARSRHAER